jgi:hypothetical protein
MSVTSIVTAAPSRGFTTVEALKARVDTGTTPDAILAQDIEAWSLRFEGLADRVLAKERVIETIYGRGLAILILQRRPIVEVHSISIGDTVLDEDLYRVSEPSSGMVRLELFERYSTWLSGDSDPGLASNPPDNRYVVDYTGGFVLPGWDEETYGVRDLPIDVELAIVGAIKVGYGRQGPALAAGLTAERLGDYSWSAGSSSAGGGGRAGSVTDITPAFAELAGRYRNFLL